MCKQISKVSACDAVPPELVDQIATIANSFFKLADCYFPR